MPLAVQKIAIVGSLARTILGFRGDLITALVARGHQVFAFANDYTEESEAQVRALGAVPVRYSLSQFGLNPFAELATTWQLYKLFKKHKISLSLCYFIKPVIYGGLAAWFAEVPIRVAKIEGLGRAFTQSATGMTIQGRLLQSIQLLLLRFSLPKNHLVFFLNPEDRADLIEKHRIAIQRSYLINGIGVHLDRYPHQPAPINPIKFIFVGRLLNEKGIRYFLQAAESIKQRYHNVEFVVLGEPDDGRFAITRKELNQFVARGIVTYPGRVSDVVPWLSQASVFVLPSFYREGVPRSTQEAMAVGRAVITTDMPGCRQTVQQGKNGFLVPVHDQAALEAAMIAFINAPNLVVSMGQTSRLLAEQNFDVAKINEEIISQLAQL